MEERRILARAAAGDEQAWTALVRRYGGMLSGVAYSMRLQPSDAEDAAQQTWIALRENISELRDARSVGAWLGVVMRRRCLAVLAQQRRERPDERIEDRLESVGPAPVVSVQPVDNAVLWGLVDNLPGRERMVVRALYADVHRSYGQVSRELGIPVGSIGPVRMRALRRLSRMAVAVGLSADATAAAADSALER